MSETISISFLITAFVTIFVVVGAPSAATVFLSLTADLDRRRRRMTALKACATASLILSVFTLFGDYILSFFGITVGAFQIAGGVLLFFIGFSMLSLHRPRAVSTPEEEADGATKEDVSVVPMAIPILAGPASITTVMVLSAGSEGWGARLAVLVCAVLTLTVTFVLFVGAELMHRVLGKTGIRILERVMGLILSVMAVQFVIDGIKKAFFPL